MLVKHQSSLPPTMQMYTKIDGGPANQEMGRASREMFSVEPGNLFPVEPGFFLGASLEILPGLTGKFVRGELGDFPRLNREIPQRQTKKRI